MKISRRKFLLTSLFLSPGAVMGDAFWLEPGWIKIQKVRIGSGKVSRRLVHITDIHHKGDRAYLESIVNKVNALSPDLVCFTGDLIEDSGWLAEALEWMGKIRSPLYGVPGNHDYWAHASFAAMSSCFAATGGKLLLDSQGVAADGKICVTGASCAKWWEDAKPIFRAPKPGCFNLMLLHYPMFADQLPPRRYDLILAGHSHGGQVRIPFHGPLIDVSGSGKYDMGLFETKAGPLYVNPGLGWLEIPVRFNCRPEITVIEI